MHDREQPQFRPWSDRAWVRRAAITIPLVLIALLGAIPIARWLNQRPMPQLVLRVPTATIPVPTPSPSPLPCQLTLELDRTDTIDSTAIAMLSPNEGWASGSDYPPEGLNPGSRTYGFFLHYQNNQWSQVRVPYLSGSYMPTGMSAVGGDRWVTAISAKGNKLLRYHDGQWMQEPVPPIAGYQDVLGSLSMDSATDGWAIMGQNFWHSEGRTWIQNHTGQPDSVVQIGIIPQHLRPGWPLRSINSSIMMGTAGRSFLLRQK